MIIASLATIPHRAQIVELAVRSLHRQDDIERIIVHFAGVSEPPSWVRNYPRVEAVTSAQTGMFAAEAKLLPLRNIDSHSFDVLLTCDDDITYPRDYAKKMVAALDRHKGSVACVYGCVIDRAKVAAGARFKDVLINCRTEGALAEDQRCHLVGTGTMALRRCDLPYIDMASAIMGETSKAPNSTDVALGMLFARRGIPIVSVARPHRWLQSTPHGGWTLSGSMGDTWRQDWMIRSVDWPEIEIRERNKGLMD